ncbi:MAG: hypothetical protein OXC25_05325 [Thiotrichales bacterium]|nr:hypothetical protein [Thiotrichales bacterium]MCY4286671.1 hypothetical protein [Thiotrichales bacterium]MCY4349252.1 hypothetical protein [Thiotrichales bacterium]
MSAATSFNALAIARELEAAGVERRQAEVIADGMRQAAGADRDELATKADLAGFATKSDLAALEVRIVKWAIGLAFGVAAVVLAGVRLMLGTMGG